MTTPSDAGSPRVAEAKDRILRYICGDNTAGDLYQHLDALIAVVRAESALLEAQARLIMSEIAKCPRCPSCAESAAYFLADHPDRALASSPAQETPDATE